MLARLAAVCAIVVMSACSSSPTGVDSSAPFAGDQDEMTNVPPSPLNPSGSTTSTTTTNGSAMSQQYDPNNFD
jgi:hypothetical protein